MKPRNFHCTFQGGPCTDKRCKAGHCVPELEIEAKYASAGPAPRKMSAEVAKEAKAVAIFILKEKRIKPTKELVAKVMALAMVQQEAERRIEAKANAPPQR